MAIKKVRKPKEYEEVNKILKKDVRQNKRKSVGDLTEQAEAVAQHNKIRKLHQTMRTLVKNIL